jgi:integrase
MGELRARADISARALEFIILTAARSGEARGAVFGEIDFAAKVWNVPAARMKSRREHRVPLPPRAIAIVSERMAEAKKVTADIGNFLIFPGLLSGRPPSDMTLLLAVKRLKRDATVHGMRAAFKTWAAERTNFPREVVEAALAHLNGDKVEAAYHRGDLFEKRRRLMTAWSSYATAAPRAPAEVVPITSARHDRRRRCDRRIRREGQGAQHSKMGAGHPGMGALVCCQIRAPDLDS